MLIRGLYVHLGEILKVKHAIIADTLQSQEGSSSEAIVTMALLYFPLPTAP